MEFNYEEYKKRTRKVESGGNDSAKNPNSSASGRYQFTQGTWEGLGFDWGQRFDPVMQERAMEKFTNNNVNYFKKNFKKEPTYADTYGMHFLGSAGYKQVYGAADSTPIEQVVTPGAYSANKSVFSKYKTVGEFKGWLRSKAGEGSAEVAPQQTAQLITPELQTMEGVGRDEVVDLSFAEKAKQAIQQYQTQEDLIAQMPMQSEQTITPQQVEQRPNYDYLFNQDLFQLSTPQFQQGGKVKSQYEPTVQKSLIGDRYYYEPSLRDPIKKDIEYLIGTNQIKDKKVYNIQGSDFRVTRGEDDKGGYYSVYNPDYYKEGFEIRQSEYYDRYYDKDLKPINTNTNDISSLAIFSQDKSIKNTEERTKSEKEALREWLTSPKAKEIATKRGVDLNRRVENLDNTTSRISDEYFSKNPLLRNAAGAYDSNSHAVSLRGETSPSTAYHEFNHATTRGERDITEKDKNDIAQRLRPNVGSYLRDPSEIQARINSFRRELEQRGVYNPKKDNFTKSVLDTFKKESSKSNTVTPWRKDTEELLRSVKTDEDLIWLMNNIVFKESANNNTTPYV